MSTADLVRGVVINPYTKSINEVEVDLGDIKSLASALFWVGDPPVEQVGVAASFPNGDNIIVTQGGNRQFRIGEHDIHGMALVLGSDKHGEWKGAEFGLVDLQNYVRFAA